MGMYETIFILDSLLVPEEIDKIIDHMKQMVESNGGKVVSVDKWGKRRLAYEIQKKQYGFYVAIEFEGEGPIPNALEHEYNFNDKILRYLTYRYTKNKMKAREKELEMKKSEPKNMEIKEPASAPPPAPTPASTPAPAPEPKDAPAVKAESTEPVEDSDAKPVDEEVKNA